jgi:hypothetical protein
LVLRLNQETHHQFWGQTGRNHHHRFWGRTRENRRHRFWGQTGKNRPSGFEAKPLTTHRPWFLGSTKKPTISFEAKLGETITTGFEAKPGKTIATGFEAKLKKTVPVILRPNHWQPVNLGF